MVDNVIDATFNRLVTEDRPAAEIITALLDHDLLILHFPEGPDGLRPAAAVPGEHGQLIVVFTSSEQLAITTSDRGNLQPVSVRLRTFLESVPPDVGLLINPGCSISRAIEWPFIQEAFPGFGLALIQQEPTDEWLSQINQDLASRDVSPERRPWEAFSAYEKASGFPFALGSARATRIFEWFENNTKREAHLMPPLMLFAYYFDASFWAAPMPVIYGRPEVNPYDSLEMPSHVLARLIGDNAAALQYRQFWAMCYDYAYGIDDFMKQTALGFASHVAAAGKDQADAATALLLEQRPNVRALEASALATEMLLKLFLAVRDGLTDDVARRQYRHGIPDLLSRCTAVAPAAGFGSVAAAMNVFPPTAERYRHVDRSRVELWRGYGLAVRTGAIVMNELTDRHLSRQVQAF